MDLPAYLARIGYTGPTEPTAANLAAIHRAHMLHVPFENLDIYGGRRHIPLDLDWFFAKVVGERRGGFCYELNGLFGAALAQLGYHVALLSARVVANNKEGPEFDHLLVLVTLEGEGDWIVDVGFGDSSLIPLRLEPEVAQGEPAGMFRLLSEREGESWAMQAQTAPGKWLTRYRFSTVPHPLSDFAAMCAWHQASPDSHFTQNNVCTLATPCGRITVSGNRLLLSEDGARSIHRIESDAERAELLKRHFGVVLTDVPQAAPAKA